MRIALELARHNHVYEDIATKFFEHFLYIAEAMTNIGDQGIGRAIALPGQLGSPEEVVGQGARMRRIPPGRDA
jgi:hypothetical protein